VSFRQIAQNKTATMQTKTKALRATPRRGGTTPRN